MNRRSFLRAAPVAGAVIVAPALALATPSPITLEDVCDYHAEKLSEAMQKLHGGKWHSHISHATRYALVRQA